MKNLVKLSEVSVNRILNALGRNGYCIISASRCKNTQLENNKLNKQLIEDIQYASYSYTPVCGGYKEKSSNKDIVIFEKSVIIYNLMRNGKSSEILNLIKFTTALCEKYCQECFIAVYPGKPPAWINSSGKILKTFSSKFKVNDLMQTYFSAFKCSKTAYQRIAYVPEAYVCIPCNWLARQLREA